MVTSKATQRTCPNGHVYYKSSACPVCPICESGRLPQADFMKGLSAPARRALEREGIKTIQQLSACTEKEILALHGIGPSALPKLRAALAACELGFKQA